MNRYAFSLVEMLVVILIFTLLLYTVINLLLASSRQFSHLEESVSCTVEASNLIAFLRRDFEQCLASSTSDQSFQMARSVGSFTNGVLSFSAAENNALNLIEYDFDAQNKAIHRHFSGSSLWIARGFLTSFSATYQILGDDEVIRSYPPDSENIASEPILPDKPPQVLRIWIKIIFTMEYKAKGSSAVTQKYEFRIFPQRLNRQLRSIWYSHH
ncbi:MAG: prepilin-type N-terminal cleavage/methylation domain-containing protein [Candidatus Riflebacteria bacterium]|nr:prepilin-type N-terminal cleavage/methylation domain-containing protein [Candidatus Riflebacteria bacterium]